MRVKRINMAIVGLVASLLTGSAKIVTKTVSKEIQIEVPDPKKPASKGLLDLLPTKYEYNYARHGFDWPRRKEFKTCDTGTQSPIDLTTEWVDKLPSKKFDAHFENIDGESIYWNGHTLEVDYNLNDVSLNKNFFTSQYGAETYGIGTEFEGAQFQFHAKAEHTIDGQRYALEMHTIHLPREQQKANDAGFVASALGIIFDPVHYDMSITAAEIAKIDNFFDSLNFGGPWHSKSAKIRQMAYGELFSVLDTKNRWVYKGSLTTPPCDHHVYWNVLRQVYPIKQHHLDLFRRHLEEENYRLLQQTSYNHGLKLLTGSKVAWKNIESEESMLADSIEASEFELEQTPALIKNENPEAPDNSMSSSDYFGPILMVIMAVLALSFRKFYSLKQNNEKFEDEEFETAESSLVHMDENVV